MRGRAVLKLFICMFSIQTQQIILSSDIFKLNLTLPIFTFTTIPKKGKVIMSILPLLTCMHTFDCSLVWSCRSRYLDIHKINVVAHLLNTLAAICHLGSVYSRFMAQYFECIQSTIMVIVLQIWEVKLYQNESSYIKIIKNSVEIHFCGTLFDSR